MIKYKKKHFALGNLANFVFWTILSSKNWTLAKLLCFFQLYMVVLRRNLGPKNVFNIFSRSLKKKLSRVKLRQKKLSNFANLQFLDDKIVWKTKFVELPCTKCFIFLYHLRVEVLQNCSAFLSFMRGFFEGMRENI